ncbi:MAG: AtpZ/AtpI family protein [Acidimicrobiia bacterium]
MELIPSKRTVERINAPRRGGETFSKGIEFVGVLLVFFGLGWFADRALGTAPWCTIALTLLGVTGQFVRVWYAYDAEMRMHEAAHLARRDGRAA